MIKKLAHPGQRFQGQFIDGLVTILLLALSIYIVKLVGLKDGLANLITFALPALYFLFSDALPNGQSLGKRILGISVIHKQTEKFCTPLQSFLRNFLTPVIGFIDAILIFGESRQRMGDLMAQTIVVKKSS